MNLRWRSLTAAMHWGFILFQILANLNLKILSRIVDFAGNESTLFSREEYKIGETHRYLILTFSERIIAVGAYVYKAASSDEVMWTETKTWDIHETGIL